MNISPYSGYLAGAGLILSGVAAFLNHDYQTGITSMLAALAAFGLTQQAKQTNQLLLDHHSFAMKTACRAKEDERS